MVSFSSARIGSHPSERAAPENGEAALDRLIRDEGEAERFSRLDGRLACFAGRARKLPP